MSGSLAHSPARIIAQLLVALSQGAAPADSAAWPVYYAREPDTPDSVITVYNTAGRRNGRFMVGGEVQEHPGVQVRVRGADHQDGYTKAKAIATALDESVSYAGVSVGGTSYRIHAVSRTSDVLDLGKDVPRSNLNIFTVNAVASIRQEA